MEGFNIQSINTNDDVVVSYTPSDSVFRYNYVITKDNIKKEPIIIDSNAPFEVKLTEEGIYTIEVKTYDIYGNETVLTSGNYTIDKTAPIITIKNKTYKTVKNKQIDVLSSVKANDNIDGDITNSITINNVDYTKTGIKTIEYTVSDLAGNTTTAKSYLTVKNDYTGLIRVGQIGSLILILFVIMFLYKYIRSIKLEKRFSKYSINSKKNSSISLLDYLYNIYSKLITKFSLSLKKSNYLSKKGEKYIKYNIAFELDDNDGMKFVARKIFVGIIYTFVLIFISIILSKTPNILEIIIPFILGYYTLDIIYFYKYSKYRKKIENDLLDAITIMNNAFKAGMSIIQAIDLVHKELQGPISKEFKKISTELSYGIDIETAFKRFADRIKISEAVYLTSSLSVLNKTGGNIIKVFESVKKTMYSKKKLENELKSLTSSSRFIMWVLIFVPVAFVIFIATINRGYFKPMFENPIGILITLLILIIYVMYIFTVRRIMKVRM